MTTDHEELKDKAEQFMTKCEFLGGMAWTEKTHDRFIEFLLELHSDWQRDLQKAKLQQQIEDYEEKASHLRSLQGIMNMPFKQDPKLNVRTELVSTQNGIKYLKEKLETLSQEGEKETK